VRLRAVAPCWRVRVVAAFLAVVERFVAAVLPAVLRGWAAVERFVAAVRRAVVRGLAVVPLLGLLGVLAVLSAMSILVPFLGRIRILEVTVEDSTLRTPVCKPDPGVRYSGAERSGAKPDCNEEFSPSTS
jgi:hypothetical protein